MNRRGAQGGGILFYTTTATAFSNNKMDEDINSSNNLCIIRVAMRNDSHTVVLFSLTSVFSVQIFRHNVILA